MRWEIGLTFQCSSFICSVSQMKSGLLLRLSWVPYTGFLLLWNVHRYGRLMRPKPLQRTDLGLGHQDRLLESIQRSSNFTTAVSLFCHHGPIFVTDPRLLVPRLSLLIPFLSLRRAALYKEEEKRKRNCLGLLACKKKLNSSRRKPAQAPRGTAGKKLD